MSASIDVPPPSWVDEPSVLWRPDAALEWWPTRAMTTREQKTNALVRGLIVVGSLAFACLGNVHVLGALLVMITGIAVWCRLGFPASSSTEAFGLFGGDNDKTKNPPEKDKDNRYHRTTRQNPLGNVLLTDRADRQAAPPAFSSEVNEDIVKQVKRAVQRMHPSLPNASRVLYGDLWQQYQLDTSMRQFYSTANTRVGNDQGAFAQWLYGDMPSAKEATPAGDQQRYLDAERYIMY